VTGLARGHTTVASRIDEIVTVARHGYGKARVLFWLGLAALPVLLAVRILRTRPPLREALADPLACVVLPSFAIVAVYSLIDFQGYSDLYPALPYAALGVSGLVALAVEAAPSTALRRAATAGGVIGVVLLAGHSLWQYARGNKDHGLAAQRATAATVERVLDPGDTLYALGDPMPLVLTGRRNPSRFIYLTSGVGRWKVRHTDGRLAGWMEEIRRAHPTVIVVHHWTTPLATRVRDQLAQRYDHGTVGDWHVYVPHDVATRAAARGVVIDGLEPAAG
jgi:hypothetical protein